MEVTARVLFSLVILFNLLQWNRSDSIECEGFRFKDVPVLYGPSLRSKNLTGRAWRKFVCCKSFRKRIGNRPSNSSILPNINSSNLMDPFFMLLLSGDVELNPGPINYPKSNKASSKEDNPDFTEILLRFEQKMESGQESILQNQSQMLNRLSSLEEQIEKFKIEIKNLKAKNSELEANLNVLSENVACNYDHGRDLQFLVDKQEQYSRKSSVRIIGMKEEAGEGIEKKTIEMLKEEIDLEIDPNEIDIVHRVGRSKDNKPRSTLVKFISHKTKEQVMRRRKMAKYLKISEDLAPGIKKIFDEVSSNRRFLDVDSVWTIDGKIKYRHINNPRTFEIRSYADYHSLFNLRQ